MANIVDIDDLPKQAVPLTLKNRYLPARYDVKLDVSPAKKNYAGQIAVSLIEKPANAAAAAGSPEDPFEVTLHTAEIVSMKASILVGGETYKVSKKLDAKAQTTTYTAEDLTFEDVSKAVGELVLNVSFIGVVHEVLTYDDFTKGVYKTHYSDPKTGKSVFQLIATHCQPHFCRNIFPCVDELAWKAAIKLTLTTNDQFDAASNMPIDETTDIDDKKMFAFQTSPKMSTCCFSFVLGNLETIETTAAMKENDKFPIRIITQCGESHRAQFALETVKTYLPLLEKKLRLAYPLPKMDVAALPFLSDGGVENWSLISVINDHILLPDWQVAPAQLVEIKKNIRLVLVHELVHMYVGDYASFDSYDHTWLNEANATFMANTLINEVDDHNLWFNQANQDLLSVEAEQRFATATPIHRDNVKTDKIDDTFTRDAYNKGIFVERMLGSILEEDSGSSFDNLFRAIGDFVKEHQCGVFKPIDLWNFIKSHEVNSTFKYDVPNIMTSWTRTAGYPVLTIKHEDDGKIVAEQHRFLYDASESIEDVPFQIPLLVRNSDGKIVRQMLTDRKLLIDTTGDDEMPELLFFNANNAVLATVRYTKVGYDRLGANLTQLNKIEQSQLFRDFSTLIGSYRQDPEVILGFMNIIKSIKKARKLEPTALNLAIQTLINVGESVTSLTYFKNEKMFKSMTNFLEQTANRLLPQFKWDSLKGFSQEEITLRNSLLSISYSSTAAYSVAKTLYKKLMHGPKDSIPKELLTTILAIIQNHATAKEYKDIHKLVRTPGLVVNNVIQPSSPTDVQTAAINSLGFVTKPELQHKTLMFVSTNMDVALVELALVGLKTQPAAYKQLWDWYKLQYLQFYSRYTRNKNDQQGKFFVNLTQITFECCLHDDTLTNQMVKFIKEKNAKVLNDCLDVAEDNFKDVLAVNKDDEELFEAL